ncbi:MAG TPA: iron-containing alcohol dehydrogenase [Solirubrobacterales bacterium]|nr:iron-containing alcohol dehydrogenase [Solirubrobacterales bacterium]
MGRGFVWRDAGRTVVFGEGGVERAVEVFAEHGVADFELLSTERALAGAPKLAEAASAVHEVPSGQVPDLAATLLQPEVALLAGMRQEVRPQMVALGGGRVVDVVKAVASVTGADVIAIPTTMSGAEMTAIHRLPAGAESRAQGMVRPRLVIADPAAMTSQPEAALRASSMNALAHGADSLYTPFTNPLSEHAAVQGAGLIATALDQDPAKRDRAGLALGSILCGYAIDSAGLGLHHVICQTLVRLTGTPHAETNAAILPPALAFLASRAPQAFESLAAALGTDLDGLAPRITALGQPPALAPLSTQPENLEPALEAMLKRSELSHVPCPAVTHEDLAGIVAAAWK